MTLRTRLIPALLAAAAAFAACDHESSRSNVDAADSKTKTSGSDLEGKAKGAVAKGKEEWKKFVDTRMPEVDREIGELKEEVAKASGSAKVELDKLVQEIGEKRKVLEEKLGELKTASAETWQAARGDIDHALGDLKRAIDQALDKTK